MVWIKVRRDRTLVVRERAGREFIGEVFRVPGRWVGTSRGIWIPEADMLESELEVLILVNLAGVRQQDVELTFWNGHLRLKALRRPLADPKVPSQYHQLELDYGEAERIWRIPVPVDERRLEASLQDGVLKVRLPKKAGKRTYRVEIS